MKILHTTEIQSVSGGMTLDELRNTIFVITPIAGAVCGLITTKIFDLNTFSYRLAGAAIGAIGTYAMVEMSIGDAALRMKTDL